MLRRIVPLLLVSALFFALCGCEKIDLSGKTDDPAVAEGNEISVKSVVTGEFSFLPDGSRPGTERILAQFEEAEKACGCKITVEVVTPTALNSALLRSDRAKSRYADLIQTDAETLTLLAAEGRLRYLEDLKLSPSVTGALKLGEKTYGFRADGWDRPLPSASYMMFYNTALLAALDCDDPAEYWQTGTWDWAHFFALAQKTTQITADGPVYALAAPTEEEKDLMWATLYAAGTEWFSADGRCTMDSAAAVNGFAKLKELSDSRLLYRLLSEESDTADATAKQAFCNRRTAFLVGNASLIYETDENSISEAIGEDLRMIPFPTIPGGRSNTVAFTEQDLFCAIPKYANADLCAKVLPILFSAGDTDVTEERKTAYFFSDADADRYAEALVTAGTDSRMQFGEERKDLSEEYLFNVTLGTSAKEILSNLEQIFNYEKTESAD